MESDEPEQDLNDADTRDVESTDTASERAPHEPTDPATLVARLVKSVPWPDPQLLEQIAAAGEAALEPLFAFMRTYPQDDDGRSALFQGLGILGRIRSPASIPVAVEVFLRYSEDMADLASGVLGRLGEDGFEAALELLRDHAMDASHRLKLIFAARQAAGDDPAMKARVAEVVRPILVDAIDRARAQKSAASEESDEDEGEESEGEVLEDVGEDTSGREEDSLDEDDSAEPSDRADSDASTERAGDRGDPYELEPDEEAAFLISELADLADPESLDLIKTAYAEDLADPWIIDLKFVEEQYRHGGESIHPTWDWLEEYNDRYQRHIEYKNRPPDPPRTAYISEVSPDIPRPLPPQEPIRRTGPKVGRNDPCWCGSGKKYKKCHLQMDERA